MVKCPNCLNIGHGFKGCTNPIVSFGILIFKRESNGSIKFLLIQRKDSMGYIDFLRGRYNNSLLKTLLEETTDSEKKRITTLSFDELWEDLWVNKKSRIYLHDKYHAKLKFEKINPRKLITCTPVSKWNNQEFDIPKGRRKNYTESDIECAIRECKEETGIDSSDYEILSDKPLEEYFIGSNGIYYVHRYYLAKCKYFVNEIFDETNLLQSGEVRKIVWVTLEVALKLLRNYDVTKKNILLQAQLFLNLKN